MPFASNSDSLANLFNRDAWKNYNFANRLGWVRQNKSPQWYMLCTSILSQHLVTRLPGIHRGLTVGISPA